MSKLNISSPWIEYYRKVEAIFGPDPDVTVKFDNDNYVLRLYVKGQDKADAISYILPTEKVFGNVKVSIIVVPDNDFMNDYLSVYHKAFEGNPIVSYMTSVDKSEYKMNYIVFENKVVQFYNDDLGDINGLESTLYEDLAKDLFIDRTGVYFCTDVEDDKLEKPLGEWP